MSEKQQEVANVVTNDDDGIVDDDGDDNDDVDGDDSGDGHQMSELMIETSPVWHFFDLESVDGEEKVRCSECSQVRIPLHFNRFNFILLIRAFIPLWCFQKETNVTLKPVEVFRVTT